MKNLIRTAAFAALIVPALVIAAPGENKPKGEGHGGNPFERLDTNKDGKLSKEEYLASKPAQKDPEAATKRFEKADANKDGFLTPDEFKATMPKPKEGQGEGGKKKKHGEDAAE